MLKSPVMMNLGVVAAKERKQLKSSRKTMEDDRIED